MPPPNKEQPHPLTDLLLTIILPSVILEFLSKPDRLGPAWALVVALMLPLGFGIYCFIKKRGLNFFSVLGLVAILVTGGLGLLNLSAVWFAVKEAAFPVFLGLAFPLSFAWGKPLVTELLLNPQVINHSLLQESLDSTGKQVAFRQLLKKASWVLMGTMMLSAVANALLVLHYLEGTVPGTEAYTQAIGRQNWVGFIVIGVPMMGAMMALLFWMLGRLQALTGLERDDLMNPGNTVRRQVGE
ncbi:VC0807 family protein [Prosthecobacter sp. SYSU 5D2]|uniref:VC0807 family protein n=1 Tax=Prosthecobacter sp. SYSU 5D2 TaxID=3134134 RepID=UPI0031FE74EC